MVVKQDKVNMPFHKQKAKLKDIAELCGVTSYSVSRTLAGKDGNSVETKERIWKVARALNYCCDDCRKVTALPISLTMQISGSACTNFKFCGRACLVNYLSHTAV